MQVAGLMALACRTAPKTKGIDNIISFILDKPTLSRLIRHMDNVGKSKNKKGFLRDAENLKKSAAVLVIGVESKPAGLDYCSFCGYKDCAELTKSKAQCAFNLIDLGIAASSAAETAGRLHADNRIMYSVGKAAIDIGLFGKRKVAAALGIPLSASGKNIYFDRK